MSVECAECERDLRGGHDAGCSRRCRVADGADQCERPAGHEGIHAIYDMDGEDVKRCWPNSEPSGSGSDS